MEIPVEYPDLATVRAVLKLRGLNDLGAIMPGTPAYVPENRGKHLIHTGGVYASYLQVPVKPV